MLWNLPFLIIEKINHNSLCFNDVKLVQWNIDFLPYRHFSAWNPYDLGFLSMLMEYNNGQEVQSYQFRKEYEHYNPWFGVKNI